MDLAKYRKFIVALAGFFGTLSVVLSDGDITGVELGTLLTAALAAGGVFLVKNKPLEG